MASRSAIQSRRTVVSAWMNSAITAFRQSFLRTDRNSSASSAKCFRPALSKHSAPHDLSPPPRGIHPLFSDPRSFPPPVSRVSPETPATRKAILSATWSEPPVPACPPLANKPPRPWPDAANPPVSPTPPETPCVLSRYQGNRTPPSHATNCPPEFPAADDRGLSSEHRHEPGALARFPRWSHPWAAFLVIPHDRFTTVSPRHHVIHRPGIFACLSLALLPSFNRGL